LILWLGASALADPPAGEVLAGLAGNTEQGYGFVGVNPSLARSSDASVVLQLTASHLYYQYYEAGQWIRADSPGASLAFGFKYLHGAVSYGLSTGLEVRDTGRHPLSGGKTTHSLDIGALVGGDIYALLGRRAVLSVAVSFSGANTYLWSRIGFKHQIIPAFKRHTWAQLWLGVDATARGNQDARALEAGVLAEVPFRDLHAAVNVRGGLSVEDVGEGPVPTPTVGLGMYYSY
jgi:hypothetical protein